VNKEGNFKMDTKKRVIIAKLGMDSHDLGSRYVARKLSESGFEVIYFPFYEAHELVNGCIQEGADVLGITFTTGSQLHDTKAIFEAMKKENILDTPVVLGGIIPEQDIEKLKKIGVKGVFPAGSDIDEIIAFFKAV
jgi:methylmalonyl-CoA mutase C-terminal domain/subunit